MIILTAYVTDEALANMQVKLGTAQAAPPRGVAGKAFIRSSESVNSMPGYNKVDVVLPIDGENLLKDLGYIDG